VLIFSCSSASFVENWKSPDIILIDAQKVLIVGMTQNETARGNFESKLQKSSIKEMSRQCEVWMFLT